MIEEELNELMLLKSENKTNLTLVQKLKYAMSNITVEPVLALFMISNILAMLATQNLNLEKACRVNLGFNNSVCNNLGIRKTANHKFEEDEVQRLIASVQGWKNAIRAAVPVVLMLFMGAWSDKTGQRKICMLMPIFGELMTCILNMVNTYFFLEVPVEVTVFMEEIFPSLMGGWGTMLLGVHSYLADITSKETRTFRLGILGLCMKIGFPIGKGLSGILLRFIGFYGVFSISACLHVINFGYVLFFLNDHGWNKSKEKVYRKRFIREFFDFHSLKHTFEIFKQKGPRNKRLKLFLILIGVCLLFGPMWGELTIIYIFTRYRFNWDAVTYSIFSTYSLVTYLMGTILAISVLSKKLKFDDAVLGIISTSSKIAGALVFAFARTDLEVYLAPLVEMFNGTTTIALRSIASKLVTNQELGKLFSLFGVAEMTMPLIFAPLYSRVYILTLHVLPGAVFLISVLATVLALGIFTWLYSEHKKDSSGKGREISITSTVPVNLQTVDSSSESDDVSTISFSLFVPIRRDSQF